MSFSGGPCLSHIIKSRFGPPHMMKHETIYQKLSGSDVRICIFCVILFCCFYIFKPKCKHKWRNVEVKLFLKLQFDIFEENMAS